MASLPISGFVTPEQEFKGIYRLGAKIEQQKQAEEEQKKQAEVKRFASDKYFTNYLDPKDRFTGTLADPAIAEKLSKALSQAYDLSAKGANDNEIFMAISPLVNQVNDYSQKAKILQEQKKVALGSLPQKGIDKLKFNTEFDQEVFTKKDPVTGAITMKDISTIDPSFNYADEVLKNRDVYNSEGFDEYVSKSGKNTTVEDLAVYGKDRSLRRTKAEMTMPSFMTAEKDSRGGFVGFVPKYVEATDGDNKLIHTFLGDNGEEIKAPVRLLSDDVFNDLPTSSKAYLRQEARKFAMQNDIPLNSPQAENLAKALAYDELKNSGKQFSTMKETQVQKAAPTPITRVTINNAGGSGVNINDIHAGILEKTKEHKDTDKYNPIVSQVSGKKIVGGTPVSSLDDQEVEVVMDKVKKAGYDKLNISGVYLLQTDDNKVTIFRVDDDKAITSITRVGANLGKQANTKGKAAVVAEGNVSTPKPQASQSNKKEISRSDIQAKAAAAGYSAKEYEKLLIQKGISIKD